MYPTRKPMVRTTHYHTMVARIVNTLMQEGML